MSTTAIRFLVVRGKPLVVIDVGTSTSTGATTHGATSRATSRAGTTAQTPRLYRALMKAGLSAIEPHADAELSSDVGLYWVLDGDQVQLETVGGRPMLRIGTSRVDQDWLEATRQHDATTLLAGIELGLDRDDSTRQVLNHIDRATRHDGLVGARVAVKIHHMAAVPPWHGRDDAPARSERADTRAARADTRATPADRDQPDDGRWWPPNPAGRFGLMGAAALLVVAMVGQAIVGEGISSALDPIRPLGFSSTDTTVTLTSASDPSTNPGIPASWVVTGADGTPLQDSPSDTPTNVAAPGLTWPILEEIAGGYRVATHCSSETWVAVDDVARPNVARDDGMAGAVIVLDAGHGGLDSGAAGPNGLRESDLNLEVAERLQTMLSRSNDIDLDTGAVTNGTEEPSAAAVLMTRDQQDGKDGDQRTSLLFRGQLASVAEADAFLSIHHNAGDGETFDEPATEVYYSVADAESERLASLVIEELRRSLAPLAAQWRGNTIAGAIGRQDSDGTDFYTVLEQSTVPAIITEALYISDPDSEVLATTDEFQNAQAEALYRALVRFLDTGDTGPMVGPARDYAAGEPNPYDFSNCSLGVEGDSQS